MFDFWILEKINRWVATSEQTFIAALFLSDTIPFLLIGMLMIWLWYSSETIGKQNNNPFTQTESRERVLLTIIAAVMTFIVIKPINQFFFRARPLISFPIHAPIDPNIWNDIIVSLKDSSSFPSDHTAFFAAITIGVFLYNRWAGMFTGMVGLFFGFLRVGVGFQYPTDIISGMAIGLLVFSFVYILRTRLTWVTSQVIQLFKVKPAFAYSIGFFFLVDLTEHMTRLFGFFAVIAGK